MHGNQRKMRACADFELPSDLPCSCRKFGFLVEMLSSVPASVFDMQYLSFLQAAVLGVQRTALCAVVLHGRRHHVRLRAACAQLRHRGRYGCLNHCLTYILADPEAPQTVHAINSRFVLHDSYSRTLHDLTCILLEQQSAQLPWRIDAFWAQLQLSLPEVPAQARTPGITQSMSPTLCIQVKTRLCRAAGKFLERRLIYAPGKQDALVTDRDLFVGARLPIAQRVFELTEADAFTMQCAPWSRLPVI